MGHQAGDEFFIAKRRWSVRKDDILGNYLAPYLSKVGTLKKPIVLIDGFAGKGRFDDGSVGSPLIMAEKAKAARERRLDVSVMCIESSQFLYEALCNNVGVYDFAQTRPGRFVDFIHEIDAMADSNNLFIYLDPFAIKGLEWTVVETLFRHLESPSCSMEVLINFNAYAFLRRGLEALQLNHLPASINDADFLLSTNDEDANSRQRLNYEVGGPWWQEILRDSSDTSAQVEALKEGFCNNLRRRFRHVCATDIKEHWHSKIPKYYLVFGSRNADAIILMNDNVAKQLKKWADEEIPPDELLFESRPESMVPNPNDLQALILACAMEKRTRRDLKAETIQRAFGKYTDSEYNSQIALLVKDGRLEFTSATNRLNEDALILARQGGAAAPNQPLLF